MSDVTRRAFLTATTLGAVTASAKTAHVRNADALRPNILFVHTDQQSIDTLSAWGNPDVSTPQMDRLASQGTSFMESYSANPVCCPARGSWYTGRMSSEHGIRFNGLPMRKDIPDLGQWFREGGYDSVYVGKWHVTARPVNESFDVLHYGTGQGELSDSAVSRSVQGFLRNRNSSKPFFLNAGFLQPHDVCYWLWQHQFDPDVARYPEIEDDLPPVPPNLKTDFAGLRMQYALGMMPVSAYRERFVWSDQQWRRFIWAYYRQVEMVDAHIGRILDTLEDTGLRDNTILLFSADHGEARGRHLWLTKGTLFEESVKVPFIASCPGRIPEGVTDRTHLVSGVDVPATFCDYAGLPQMPKARGRSLRPLLEEGEKDWRDHLHAEAWVDQGMIRTSQYKYIRTNGHIPELLFDMKRDPWEMDNLAKKSEMASVLAEHQALLRDSEARLERVPEPKEGWQAYHKECLKKG